MCCIVNTLVHEYWSLKVGASERGQPPKRGQKGCPHSVLSLEVLLYNDSKNEMSELLLSNKLF